MSSKLWTLAALPADQDINLFFALLPPPSLRPSMARLGAQLRSAHGLGGNSVGPERLHVTMANCLDGGLSVEEAIVRARMVGNELSYPAFPITFEWTESFYHRPGRCPLVLRGDHGLTDLCAFRRVLHARMLRAGFAVPSSFTPHVTLLWADRPVGAHPIAPVRWTVEELVLVLSPVGQSRHIHLARWCLY
jgi:2'-5' RNA ligase